MTDDDGRKRGKKVRLNNHSDAPLGKAVNHKAALYRNNTQTWQKKKSVLVFGEKTNKYFQKRFVLFRVRRQVVEESIEEGCFTTGNILS